MEAISGMGTTKHDSKNKYFPQNLPILEKKKLTLDKKEFEGMSPNARALFLEKWEIDYSYSSKSSFLSHFLRVQVLQKLLRFWEQSTSIRW